MTRAAILLTFPQCAIWRRRAALPWRNRLPFFVGENGTGKSTLLEAIAVGYGFNPEGGTMNYRFSTFDDVSELSGALSYRKGFKRPRSNYFFRAESFFPVISFE